MDDYTSYKQNVSSPTSPYPSGQSGNLAVPSYAQVAIPQPVIDWTLVIVQSTITAVMVYLALKYLQKSRIGEHLDM